MLCKNFLVIIKIIIILLRNYSLSSSVTLNMLKLFCIFILALKTISAKISIDVSAGNDVSDIRINYTGIDVKLVTDHEIKLFDISNRNLKEALKKHYGTQPTNVYIKSPTPWGDLYTKYHWEQIKRVLSVKSSRMKGIRKTPVVVLSQDFENLLNNTIKVNTGISQTVENTITTSWTRNKEIVISQEVEYDVNVLFSKITGTTGFSYSSSWGESEERSETITIGTTSNVETELQPGQRATAILTATRGYLEIEVEYLATLRGNLAVNFKKKYNGHHFHGPPIGNVLNSGGMSNEKTATEVIKVGFYADATLKIYDKRTGQPL
ncbi:spherulin-2A-like [Pectinophora gossypiella]|uniref:spherulin-2A-like n=1 Tax=Pectinophora gossypiella TaxID=13191 RepID=UPI00214F10B9|nr:spherulin-2A-like [Pectinophora gossypiella]